jgi:hypothetical protein
MRSSLLPLAVCALGALAARASAQSCEARAQAAANAAYNQAMAGCSDDTPQCRNDSDCASDQRCVSGSCVARPPDCHDQIGRTECQAAGGTSRLVFDNGCFSAAAHCTRHNYNIERCRVFDGCGNLTSTYDNETEVSHSNFCEACD